MSTATASLLTVEEFWDWFARPQDLSKRAEQLPRVLDDKDELTGEDVLLDLKFRAAEFFNLSGEVAA